MFFVPEIKFFLQSLNQYFQIARMWFYDRKNSAIAAMPIYRSEFAKRPKIWMHP
jgi:hypothetical protein